MASRAFDVEAMNRLQAEQGIAAYDLLTEQSAHPMEENEALLREILADNRATEIGRAYDFASIASVGEFQRRLPVTTYDDYADYVHRMVYDDEGDLMTAYPVEIYCYTNGTMGNPKILPMTRNAIEAHVTYNNGVITGLKARELGEGWMRGRALYPLECKLVEMRAGKRYGNLSALLLQRMFPVISQITPSPRQAMFPEGDTDTRYLQARYSLADPTMAAINGSFLSYTNEIFRYIEAHWELLARDIELGAIDASVRMPESVRAELTAGLEPLPGRAAELRAVFGEGFDEPFAPRVWPALSLIGGIGTGIFEFYRDRLKERYVGHEIPFVYSGISSTEALVSVPVHVEDLSSALVPRSVFYEFLPVEADDDLSRIRTLAEVEAGEDYEVVVTNQAGLYRYRTRDIVRVTGFYNELPMIRIQGRADNALDIISEHTPESSFDLAARQTAEELDFELMDYSIYIDRDALPPRHVFFLEIGAYPEGLSRPELRRVVRDRLYALNPKLYGYESKGWIDPPEVNVVQDETYMLYRDVMVARGRNSAQLKPPRVIVNEMQRRFFFGLQEPAWDGDVLVK